MEAAPSRKDWATPKTLERTGKMFIERSRNSNALPGLGWHGGRARYRWFGAAYTLFSPLLLAVPAVVGDI